MVVHLLRGTGWYHALTMVFFLSVTSFFLFLSHRYRTRSFVTLTHVPGFKSYFIEFSFFLFLFPCTSHNLTTPVYTCWLYQRGGLLDFACFRFVVIHVFVFSLTFLDVCRCLTARAPSRARAGNRGRVPWRSDHGIATGACS